MGKKHNYLDINDWVKDRVRPDGIGGTTWGVYDEYVKIMEQIDFGCRFKDGDCQGRNDYMWKDQDCGCCSECAVMVGCITTIRPGSEQTYIDAWDDKDGFWSSDGCKLPRNCRSLTCLEYRCREVKRNDSEEDKKRWWNISKFFRSGGAVRLIQIEEPVLV